MPKRKVYVEAIVEGVINQDEPENHDDNCVIRGWIKHYKAIFEINFEVKNTKNSGGEAWDWAQKNWPEFIPEEYPFPVIDSEGNMVTVMGKLRWACVTGVLNKKGDPLPIAEDHGRTKKTTKKKAKKKAPKAKPVPLGLGGELTIQIGGHPSKKGARQAAEDKPVDKVLAQAAAAVEDRTKEAVKKATKKSGR